MDLDDKVCSKKERQIITKIFAVVPYYDRNDKFKTNELIACYIPEERLIRQCN